VRCLYHYYSSFYFGIMNLIIEKINNEFRVKNSSFCFYCFVQFFSHQHKQSLLVEYIQSDSYNCVRSKINKK
jgi:hypothetical protein